MKNLILLIALTFAFGKVNAQLEKPVTWAYFAKKTGKNEATISLKATMKSGWHIYSLDVKGIPAKTSFSFLPSKDYILIGKPLEPKPISKYDKTLKVNLTYFEKEVVFTQKIKLNKALATIKGKVEFMACNDKQCLPTDEVTFGVPVK